MDSQDPLRPTPGDQGEQPHEKKSVFKKVKAKAKKIKSSIGGSNKTHSGQTDHDARNDHDHDEEEDEYEENDELQDSGVHGAPMHESAAAKNFAASQDASSGQSRLNMDEKPRFDENPDQNVCPGTFQAKVTDPDIPMPAAPSKDSLGVLGEHHGVGDDPNATKHRHQDVNETGGHEAGVAPIIQSFNKMGIYDDETKQKKDSPTPGSHDQLSPSDVYDEPQHKKDSTPSSTTGSNDQFTPSSDLFTSKPSTIPENAQSVPESYNAGTENHPQDMNVDEPPKQQSGTENHPRDMNVDEPPKQQSGYADKISSVSFAIANRAMSAKNVLASKIGYGGTDDSKGGENVPSAGTPTVADRAMSAKNVLASKIGYGGTDDSKGGENVPSAGMPTASTDPAATAAGEPTTQQSSYISSATSAITGKAVLAKNAVASKLGYGGSESAAGVGTGSVVNRADDGKTVGTGGVTGYGRQISSTVTAKLTPVYDKVAGAGSAVGSKLPRSTGSPGAGGNSMKGYLAEKLKPGEEDRALSEVISGAFPRRNNEDDVQKKKPMGKVTESEEVARRLGSTEEEKSGKGVVDENPGTGVVDKFTGAFTNWFGKGGETNPSQMFNDQATPSSNQGSTGEERGAENVSREGERKAQESTS